MKQLFKYFRGYIKESILAPLFKLLEASFELMVPMIVATIIDKVIPAKDNGLLFKDLILLFVFAALGIIVAITAQYYSSKAAVGYTEKLTLALYEKVMRLPRSSRDHIGTASLVARLTGDTYQIQTGINQFLRLFLRAPIIVLGAIVMAFTINATLAIWFVGMVVALFILVYMISKVVTPLYHKIRQKNDQLISLTREQIEGMRLIRVFNAKSFELSEFATVNQKYTQAQLKLGNLSNLLTPLSYLIVNGTLLLLLWHGHLLILDGHLSQGKIVALMNYLLQILVELLKLTMLLTSLNQSYIAAKRVQAIFDEKEEDLYDSLPIKYDKELILKIVDLSFTYPTARQSSLKNISVSVKKEEMLGIIGGTGSGKSTLITLIAGLYQPTSGELDLFYEGKSPKSLFIWREGIAIVPQKAELFKGTIRENLTLGLTRKCSDSELFEALKMAEADEFIKEKGGLDSIVETFGRNFSGGQRQRLTIARALLRKSKLLILDDATSALDYQTESRLLSNLKQLADTNLIVISQRTRSLETAQQILVLDKGQQVALGNHQKLLESCSIYQEIYHSQEKRSS